jgi:DNA invertase Pin-like site-specific DNA recombinase
MLSGQQKIASSQLERLAIVYLRQSSPKQVRENFRSTERQYALADEAARLGWERERVVVVDGDLGLSGRDAQARESYKQLVARVCLGEVGAIFGLEVARLGRNNAEHHRLLEFCALTDTLIVDTDGIYDLQDFNDRMILGLKAQWSEAELHIMASRLQGAKRSAASSASRWRSATSTTRRATGSSTPTTRCRPRSPTCSKRSSRPARRTAWSARSKTGGSRSVPGVAPGRASCAGGR